MTSRATLAGAGGEIDFDKLDSLMAAAVEKEERHARENAAKFRAVAQKVPNYEAFEDMVKAAHIKPVGEDITQLNLGRSSWVAGGARAQDRDRRRGAGQEAREHGDSDALQAATASSALETLPATAVEFTRVWRMQPTSHDRYRYLLHVGGRNLIKLFRLDMGHEIMGQIIETAHENYRPEDAEAVSLVLRAVVKTERFSLELEFLSDEARQQAQSLVKNLEDAGRPPEEMAKLSGKF